MSRPKRILFLTPYPMDTAGSQRFRFEQYLTFLGEKGFEYDCQSFIDDSTWSILYQEGKVLRKAWGIASGFVRRLLLFTRLHRFDFVFVHREASPLGIPFIEWLITKVWKKRLIYDFDDAIWLPNTSSENGLVAWLKFPEKVKRIISWSYKVSAGNQYLSDFASQFNTEVICNPTTIDTANRHLPQSKETKRLTIGWTGTHSTLKYLEVLRDPLDKLSNIYAFDFIVIADKEPDRAFPNQRFFPWNKETEIADLNQIDIGIMPLVDDKWSRGKCGFKALQFMALEKPVLVSPVGVNREMVEPQFNGYHCEFIDDWIEKLKILMEDESLRNQLGKAGRQKVIERYSVQSNSKNFLQLFT
ncbi:Glycosyltransferase involved in cell wall bisynthesis [Reichenbachiella faecimaris]|uniref:Glycosyltransferase involved in cell wall bisynthesis n=1 Tax=Reichenbachiella faecimaris TaxID=692418 RepID=A0A1W2GIV1_REIFA|nr:glycosyltransferase family 4 protein [Reichenbachiella faecimaris]SMD36501.1 Glycosyltransferase involved in cell wall bisynthesis [Reichenbachiella faecimaris]